MYLQTSVKIEIDVISAQTWKYADLQVRHWSCEQFQSYVNHTVLTTYHFNSS